MAEENRGPLDPAQPAASPPESGGEGGPHGNGVTPARVDPAHGPPSPADGVAAGPPPAAGSADQIAPGRPAEAREGRIRAGNPPVTGGGRAAATAVGHPTEAVLLLRWWLGLLLILGSGWGFIVVGTMLTRSWKTDFSGPLASAIWSLFSFCFFLALEQNLWLSRFMGLRLGPNSSTLKEALFFWLTGFIGLLLRSTASPEPAPAPLRSTDTGDKPPPPEMKDGFREIVETIVFVVVLVLLLKSFLAEAFVIPTGSMATTLLGYHQDVECPQCGYHSKVNMSAELDAAAQFRARVTGCTCPNCFYSFDRPGALLREGGEP